MEQPGIDKDLLAVRTVATAINLCKIRGIDPNLVVAHNGTMAFNWETLLPIARDYVEASLAYRMACNEAGMLQE